MDQSNPHHQPQTFQPTVSPEQTQPVEQSTLQQPAQPFVPQPSFVAPSPHVSEPTSAASVAPLSASDGVKPVPVVRVLSPFGVEYVFLTLTLFAAAIGLTSALLALVNGKTDFSALAFPTALLVVSVPVFGVIFLHLKKLELSRPELKLDASKRRSTQVTQIVSFIVSLLTLVGLVFAIFAKIGGQ
jgi:hypothetical protein